MKWDDIHTIEKQHDGELEKKAPREYKIIPVWFSLPFPLCDVEGILTYAIDKLCWI